jgi:hypothetical protein
MRWISLLGLFAAASCSVHYAREDYFGPASEPCSSDKGPALADTALHGLVPQWSVLLRNMNEGPLRTGAADERFSAYRLTIVDIEADEAPLYHNPFKELVRIDRMGDTPPRLLAVSGSPRCDSVRPNRSCAGPPREFALSEKDWRRIQDCWRSSSPPPLGMACHDVTGVAYALGGAGGVDRLVLIEMVLDGRYSVTDFILRADDMQSPTPTERYPRSCVQLMLDLAGR